VRLAWQRLRYVGGPLLNRTETRYTLKWFFNLFFNSSLTLLQELNRECASSYKELNQRIQRSRELRRMAQKMKTQKDLLVGYQELKLASQVLDYK